MMVLNVADGDDTAVSPTSGAVHVMTGFSVDGTTGANR